MIGNSGAVTSRPSRRRDDVEHSLDQHRRPRHVPGVVLEHRQVGDPRQAQRAGPAAKRRDHAQLDLPLPADATRPPTSPGSMLSEATMTRSTLDISSSNGIVGVVEELEVHVGEQLELAPDHLREVAIAEHRGDLARRARRQSQRATTAARRRRARDDEADRHRARVDRPGRRRGRISANAPIPIPAQAAIAGSLVDRQMADRDVVAVVEAEQLGDQHPPRQQDQRVEGVRRRRRNHNACGGGGDHVAEREHPPPAGVSPEPRPIVCRPLPDRAWDGHLGFKP